MTWATEIMVYSYCTEAECASSLSMKIKAFRLLFTYLQWLFFGLQDGGTRPDYIISSERVCEVYHENYDKIQGKIRVLHQILEIPID